MHYKHLNCAEETVDINLGDHNFKEFLWRVVFEINIDSEELFNAKVNQILI